MEKDNRQMTFKTTALWLTVIIRVLNWWVKVRRESSVFSPALSNSGTFIFLKYFLLDVRTVIPSSSALTEYTSRGYGKLRILHSMDFFVILFVKVGCERKPNYWQSSARFNTTGHGNLLQQ